MTTTWSVTVDCADPMLLARFWATALGYRAALPPDGFADWEEWLRHFEVPESEWDDGAGIEDPDGLLPEIGFLKVPEGKTAKNRWHPDLRVSGGRHLPADVRLERLEKHAATLTAAGGTELARVDQNGALDHIVMADPEGNEFCLV